MTIRKLKHINGTPGPGVVFWWSNILNSYQLRVYTEAGEVVALQQIHRDTEAVENAARTLAASMNLDIFEIEVERIDLFK